MLLNEIKPSAFLTEYIRLYRIIDFHFTGSIIIPVKAYPPRPEHCLQFYPKDLETVKYPDSDLVISSTKAAIIGQPTMVKHRLVGNQFLSLQVVFQPGALYRITHISLDELTNVYMDAEAIFGTHLRLVNEQLYHANGYAEMVCILERFLQALIKKNKREAHPVEAISKMMLLEEERFSLDKYLKIACLSHRQFDRNFKARVGIPPKQFLQLIRFDKAFRMKNRHPDKDWLSIALHCGYHDYQHLAKDYKEFTGYTPKHFFEIDNQAPERLFGDAET